MQVQEHSLARSCRRCEKFFFPAVGNVKKGYGIFCSRQCHAKSRVGQAPWNKGLTKETNPNLASTRKNKNRVAVICDFCEKEFQVTQYRIEQSSRRKSHLFCSRECYKSWFSANINFGGKAVKFHKEHIPWNKGIYYSQETIEKQRRVSKKLWQDPEFVARMMSARSIKPTKPEQRLIEIINKHHIPYEYNGDFGLGVMIGGRIPDFINTNGRKDVIELFGDYYHSPEVLGDRWQGSELGTIMVYNSLGYRCLVLWEHDLKEKSEDAIVDMIKVFTKAGKR